MNEESVATRPHKALSANILPFNDGAYLGNIFRSPGQVRPFPTVGRILDRDQVFSFADVVENSATEIMERTIDN